MERISIDLDKKGNVIVDGENNTVKDLNKELPENDTLLNFLNKEVMSESNGDIDPKIPDNAPIKLAEIAALELGGEWQDYIHMHPRDLRDIAIRYKSKHPKEPIQVPDVPQKDDKEKLAEELKENTKKNIIDAITRGMPGY